MWAAIVGREEKYIYIFLSPLYRTGQSKCPDRLKTSSD
jgi:hypothetical protein